MNLDALLQEFQALADPSRLRLLAALQAGEAAVAELMVVLDQSQPRVSRHLRLLCEAGVAEHFREGRWVYYRLTPRASEGPLARYLEELGASGDPRLAEDRRRVTMLRRRRERTALTALVRARGRATGGGLRPAEAVLTEALGEVLGTGSLGRVLDVGSGTGTVLRLLGERVGLGLGIERSHRMRLLARARLQEAGFTRVSIRAGEAHALPVADQAFDLVVLDEVLGTAGDRAALVEEAVRVLAPEGRLLVLDHVMPGPAGAGTLDAPALDQLLGKAGLAASVRRWLPGRVPDYALFCATRIAVRPRTGTDG